MARLTPKIAKIFAGGLSPSGNIAQFGSLAASSIAYSADPAVIQNLAAWANGWLAALINTPGGNSSPALEDLNGLFYVLTYQLAYLKQMGLAEWDATTTYYIGGWAQDGAGIPYVSLTDNNTGNALTDTNNWKLLKDTLVNGKATAKAWVCFDGTSGAIKDGYNVSAVARTAAGCYQLTFPNGVLANANYVWSGACGTPNGSVPAPGDNNTLVGGPPGKSVVKTTTGLTVFSWEPRNQLLEDATEITVMVFGS